MAQKLLHLQYDFLVLNLFYDLKFYYLIVC